jgi:hypothetical protein
MDCSIKYTENQYFSVFGQLKNCFGEAATQQVKELMYKIKCKENDFTEMFLYIWVLNSIEFVNGHYSKDNPITEKEFNDIMSRILSICTCNV